MQKAQHLLTNTSKTVKEIAELLGFESPCHLSKQFKTHTGFAPMHWLAQLHHPAKIALRRAVETPDDKAS